MPAPTINLIVLRVADIEAANQFYSALGFSFTKHAHGKGPTHYAAEEGPVVFEIYPQATDGDSTKGVRLGFQVSNIGEMLACAEKHGARILSPAKESPWGLRAVIEDPFGHKIEFTAQENKR